MGDGSSVASSLLSGLPSYPDENRGPTLLRTIWILISLSTVVVLARLYTKLIKTRRLYVDDGFLVSALVWSEVASILILMQIVAWLAGIINCVWVTRAINAGLGAPLATI
jgi:hypothetical protein